MKISWGIKIAVLYLSFVAMIGFMVFKSMGEKVDLVSKDYYEQELVFQEKIDARKNANLLKEKILVQKEVEGVRITFPASQLVQPIQGEAVFFRSSDSNADVKVKLELNGQGTQIIRYAHFKPGMYTLQLSWQTGNKKFYTEETVNI